MVPIFTGKKSGAHNIPEEVKESKSPLQFFQLYFSGTVVNTFVTATNEYASQEKVPKWTPLTPKMFLYFLCIIMFMGLVKLPTREHYWKRNTYGQSFAKKLMSARKFERIMGAWHWKVIPEVAKAAAKAANPFYCVDGFVEKLAQNAQKYWYLSQYIDIDEMSIYFKGRHTCKCYNPAKPEKWHFKAFCLNDGDTGYLWNFYLYKGAAEVRDPGWAATSYPIKKLTEPWIKDKNYHQNNFIMSTDNWYTSIDLCVFLWVTFGCYLVGTVKCNRKGLPSAWILKEKNKKGNKKELIRPRGYMHMVRASIQGVYIFFVGWMDSRAVHCLSTLTTTKSNVTRSLKQDGRAQFRRVEIERPDMIGLYNRGMGGTDLHDQYNTYYRTMVRCNKWPIRIFTHFLQSCVTNSYLLYKSAYGMTTAEMSLLDYTELLLQDCEEIFDQDAMEMNGETDHSDSDSDDDIVNNGTYQRRAILCVDKRLDHKNHYPFQHEKDKNGVTKRLGCRVCKKKVNTGCSKCKAFLCFKSDDVDNCFIKFHNMENFDEKEVE